MDPTRPSWDGTDPLPERPLDVLGHWLDEAFAEGSQRNPHAIALATVDDLGKPQARLVLCQEVDPESGTLTFYTHTDGQKGRELARSSGAAVVFHFHAAGRQVRAEGPTSTAPDEVSDAYFRSRPRESQLGAWASRQSEPVASREALHAQLADVERRFAGEEVPRPPGWGGYRLRVERLELWVSGPARIHDRARYARVEAAGGPPGWRGLRLQP